jgi:hypothetical protein
MIVAVIAMMAMQAFLVNVVHLIAVRDQQMAQSLHQAFREVGSGGRTTGPATARDQGRS